MASACNKFINRTTLSSIKIAIKSKKFSAPSSSSGASPFSTKSIPPSPRFSSFLSRSPAELGCAQSLLPLHSAVAIARLTSCLASNSRTCRALSQDGIDGT
eukprot:TRINITY_DN2140_c0_g1_i2.p1 TRINITY_DN2140_c0_g1~~TRINITY_DN2140_c0_g1_i2.p1  ORF type:complete len:101 (+),score=6.91 TRINITY_DN2140_c0_g1_i2:137-439(+)